MWKKIKRLLGINVYETSAEDILNSILCNSKDDTWECRWNIEKPNRKVFEDSITLIPVYFTDTLLYKNGYKLIPYDYDYKTGIYTFLIKNRRDEYSINVHFYDIHRFISSCSQIRGLNLDSLHWLLTRINNKVDNKCK